MKWVRKRVKMAPRSDREIRNIWTDPLKCCNIRISVKVCNHVRQKRKGNRNVWIFDIRNDACAYRSGCEKRDRSQTRLRIPENRERIRWPDPPLQKPQSGLFLRIHEGIPETCGDGPGLHAVGGSRCMGICDRKEGTRAGEDGADLGAGRRSEQPL